MERKIRFGVLGYARIARNSLIPAMAEARNAVPYALASQKEQGRKDAKEAFPFEKIYDGYEALLADPDVDAVYIPLPNSLHHEWTIKAARAGKHVLCEKPLGLTRKECEEMAAECEKAGVLLMEAFMYRFTERTKKVRELLDSGVIGTVRHVSSSFHFALSREGDVRLNAGLGGGSLRDVGCYPVNFIGMVMGEEPESFCALKTTRDGVDVGLSAVLKYRSGAICTLSGGFESVSERVSEINGTKGSLLVRDTFFDSGAPIVLTTDDGVTEIPVAPCKRYVLEVEHFSDAILHGHAPEFGLEESIRNCGLIDRILQKARE